MADRGPVELLMLYPESDIYPVVLGIANERAHELQAIVHNTIRKEGATNWMELLNRPKDQFEISKHCQHQNELAFAFAIYESLVFAGINDINGGMVIVPPYDDSILY